jgi:uncharacterized protein (DUF433 family)
MDMATANSADRIIVDPAICNGLPIVRGTRITVETVLGYLSAGDSVDEILAEYPDLKREDVAACLAFGSRLAGRRFAMLKTA